MFMKETKKAILELLSKKSQGKKSFKFDALVLNLALQKVDSDDFEFDGEAVYTTDKTCLIYLVSSATNFAIPEGVVTVGEMAFRSKKHLRSVTIASTVETIEKDAFYDCDKLETVYIPAQVKAVRAYAFAECDRLKQVTFTGVPEKLSRHAFDDCDNMHRIVIPEGSFKFFKKALHYSGEEEYTLLEKPAADNRPAGEKPEAPKAEAKAAAEAAPLKDEKKKNNKNK